jgi:hypothetical protein
VGWGRGFENFDYKFPLEYTPLIEGAQNPKNIPTLWVPTPPQQNIVIPLKNCRSFLPKSQSLMKKLHVFYRAINHPTSNHNQVENLLVIFLFEL